MTDHNTFELDEATTAILGKLAQEEGVTMNECLLNLLFDRGRTLVKQQKLPPSLFFALNGGTPPINKAGTSDGKAGN
jgi:hypothetical protein